MAVADHLSDAVEIYLAWGPQRMTPLRERFKEKLPPLSDADFAWLETQCGAILSMACRLADEIGLEGLPAHEAHRRLAAQWPMLDERRRAIAMQQGYYSFWRDNGRGPEEKPPAPRPRSPRSKAPKPKSRSRPAKRS
jgi:hypothetical protein